MDFLIQLWREIVEIWRRLDYSGRVTLVASGILVAVAVIALSMWSARPEYRMLFTNLTSEDADAIASDLEGRNVRYKMRDGGATILVPSDRVYSLRNQIAESGRAPSGQVRGWEIFDQPSLGVTEFVQNIQAQRARAGELARTIEAYSAVSRAIVNLSIPPERLLAAREAPPSAAVVLKLTHPGALNQSHIRGILNIVASSVPGLTPNQVTIVDTEGTVLARPREPQDSQFALSSQQLEAIQAHENHLRSKIEAVLEPLYTNFSVAVSVDMDFDQLTTDTKTYDPDANVKIAEQVITEDTKTVEVQPTAAPGATAGLPAGFQAAAGTQPAEMTSTKEEIITNYEVSVTETRRIAAPAVKNVSATVVVEPLDSEGVFRNLTSEETTQLQQMVMNAAGADETRGDKVMVMAGSFAEAAVGPPVAVPAPGMMRQQVLAVVQRHVLPIVLMVVALFLIRMILRRSAAVLPVHEPIQVPQEEVSEEVAIRRRVQEEVERLSVEQPKIVATLLKTWLSAED